MAFKEIQPIGSIPDSPEKLFLDLPRRKIPSALPHQQELIRTYLSMAQDDSDVALQLPTGSGKTLVGLLIGEWRRKKFKEKVVYLVPTKQLVNQVVEQATEKYGLTLSGFTGSHKEYAPDAKSNYKSCNQIAVTTYNSLFNSNPYFDDADIIILDDAHAAENYIPTVWTLKIERNNSKHQKLHDALCSVLKPVLDKFSYDRLKGNTESLFDKAWVDKIPTPKLLPLIDQIVEVLNLYSTEAELQYAWSMIKDHIAACHLYISAQEIFIRPLIPPTWDLPAFTKPKQRIYMSATLGQGGDLERLTGRWPIKRLSITEASDIHGVGRRFFIFPEMSLDENDTKKLRHELMKNADRSLVLVPSTTLQDEVSEDVKNNLKFTVFKANDIEVSKKPFILTDHAVAVVANRYDGIDFPGTECRLLFIDGLPRATNLQEKFLMSRMGANNLFNERIQTRVFQAIGRCTRSLEDYSAVVVSGGELPDFLTNPNHQKYFHPELQAELEFGVEQSRGVSIDTIVENFKIFLKNDEDWEKASEQIVAKRKDKTRQVLPAMLELQSAVGFEIKYQQMMWQKDYEGALEHADSVLSKIKSAELMGYRALWHYLAGCAAYLAVESGGNKSFASRAKSEFSKAKGAAPGINWLVGLARYSEKKENFENIESDTILKQVDRIEAVFSSLGAVYRKPFVTRVNTIITGLSSKDCGPFEQAHKLLGEILGFNSDNQETDGAPDPWWISEELCLVFEDHAGAGDNAFIDIRKARQVSLHPTWVKANVEAAKGADILPVLITPTKNIKKDALVFLDDVSVWALDDFKKWAENALSVIKSLRSSFTESGDLNWRNHAALILKENGFDAVSLFDKLKKQQAKSTLKCID